MKKERAPSDAIQIAECQSHRGESNQIAPTGVHVALTDVAAQLEHSHNDYITLFNPINVRESEATNNR